jgi:hypothetical protein
VSAKKPPEIVTATDAARDRLRMEFDPEAGVALVSLNEMSFYLDERDAPRFAAAMFGWLAARSAKRDRRRKK